ncbi:MAG TPA: calcium-binding protein [Patescibacteria group bacterium]|nr:calcium-binding protein [Patescibacteria group bacterium]
MATFRGTAADDVLIGTPKNDLLDGLLGVDTMTGGFGHDSYRVDDAADLINEGIGEGTDSVVSSVSYTLPDNVEHLTLTRNAVLAFGNAGDNILRGTNQANVLNGAAGADTMIGGGGDDVYFINQLSLDGINNGGSAGTDVIIDASGRADLVICNAVGADDVFYILQTGLEQAFFIMPGTNITLTGNRGSNWLVTDNGDDTLDGLQGADTLDGGDGANLYFVDNVRDIIVDGFDDTDADGPTDTADTVNVSVNYTFDAAANVEFVNLTGTRNLSVTGSATDNVITGNAARNTIHGGGGDDEIHGGGDRDKLYGDTGADTFYFDTDTGLTSVVSIMDFNVSQGDKINLEDILSGYEDGIAVEGFVKIVDAGRSSFLTVNVNGDGIADNYVRIAVINGVIGLTSEQELVDQGILILASS